jgi:hypothetical protein
VWSPDCPIYAAHKLMRVKNVSTIFYNFYIYWITKLPINQPENNKKKNRNENTKIPLN